MTTSTPTRPSRPSRASDAKTATPPPAPPPAATTGTTKRDGDLTPPVDAQLVQGLADRLAQTANGVEQAAAQASAEAQTQQTATAATAEGTTVTTGDGGAAPTAQPTFDPARGWNLPATLLHLDLEFGSRPNGSETVCRTDACGSTLFLRVPLVRLPHGYPAGLALRAPLFVCLRCGAPLNEAELQQELRDERRP